MTLNRPVRSAIQWFRPVRLLVGAASLGRLLVMLLPFYLSPAALGADIDAYKQWPRPDCPPRCPPTVELTPPQPPPPFRSAFNTLFSIPLQWLALGLIAGAAAVAFGFFNSRKAVKPNLVKAMERPLISVGLLAARADAGISVATRVAIPAGTQQGPGTQDEPRLQLYPLGHNELGPFEVLFDGRLVVGRSPDNEICIHNDEQVSAKHCVLSLERGLIHVQDAGSRNGTRVNGVRITGYMHAESGSILGVGRTELRMKLIPDPSRPT